MKIPYTCRICKADGWAELGDGCSEEWCDKLAPLLVCNPCFDLRSKFTSARDKIFRACNAIIRAEQVGLTEDDMGTVRRRCRAALIPATRQYADALREYKKLSTLVWSEDFVQNLMQKPEAAAQQLRFYRDSLSAYVKNQNMQVLAASVATELGV
jgi:hypothetical protein